MHHRYLIGVPMVKVETLGAGGGSICHVNNGAMEVGPASAGAEPGPICYGRGGTAADDHRRTVDARHPVGGVGICRRQFLAVADMACQKHLRTSASKWVTDAEGAAFDCWRVVNANMSQAVRRTTRGKGHRPAGHGDARLWRQRPGFCGHSGGRPGNQQGSGAASVADVLRAGHVGRESEHRRRAFLHSAGQ